MPHDVFISHSSHDKPQADATVAVLERHGIRCWIAPRDILPGADWGESIIDAIESSRIMVLLLSEEANRSPQIKREVERAVNHGCMIIPVRLEDVVPAKSLQYFISTPHWLDAFDEPLEEHLEYLASTVRKVLDDDPTAMPARRHRAPASRRSGMTWWRDRRVQIVGSIVALMLVILLTAAIFGGDPDRQSGEQGDGGRADRPDNATVPLARFVGTWRLEAAKMDPEQVVPGLPVMMTLLPHTTTSAFLSRSSETHLVIDELGQYEMHVNIVGLGLFQANLTRPQHGPAATGILTFNPDAGALEERVRAQLDTVQRDLAHMNQKAGDTSLTVTQPGNGAAVLVFNRPGDTGQPAHSAYGTWTAAFPLFIDSYIGYRGTMELFEDNRYRLNLSRSEKGLFEVAGQKFTMARSITAGPPVGGSFMFDGDNRFTTVEPRGTATWVRVPE